MLGHNTDCTSVAFSIPLEDRKKESRGFQGSEDTDSHRLTFLDLPLVWTTRGGCFFSLGILRESEISSLGSGT